jgi:hypothetical protein
MRVISIETVAELLFCYIVNIVGELKKKKKRYKASNASSSNFPIGLLEPSEKLAVRTKLRQTTYLY